MSTQTAIGAVVFLILMAAAFWGGAAWQGSRKDAAYQDSLDALAASISSKEQEITFLHSVITSQDAKIVKTEQKWSAALNEVVKAKGVIGFLRRLADSLQNAMTGWEEDSTKPPPEFPFAVLDVTDTTRATINDTTITVLIDIGSEFHFVDLTFRNSFADMRPIRVPVKTIETIVKEPYSPNFFGGLWFSFAAFKEYRSKFASSDLSIAMMRVGFEWNIMKDTVLETDPLAVNWSTELPQYGLRIGIRKQIL